MKFIQSEADKAELANSRVMVFSESEDRDLYLHVGYFNVWFAACEIWLTVLLAKCTKSNDLYAFDLLTRGLDAAQKVVRLRRTSERYKPIGSNLHLRLNIFENHMIPLRNKLAHTYPVGDLKRDLVAFTVLGNVPKPGLTSHPDEETIPFLELFEHAAWLNLFNNDLKSVSRSLAHAQMLEIESPQSPLLPGQGQQPDRTKSATKLGRRDRKRLRRVQQLRAKGERIS